MTKPIRSLMTFMCVWLCITFMATAWAQTGQVEQITLKQAVELALSHHPMVKMGLDQIKAADADLIVARSYFLPKLDLNEIYMRSNDPIAVFGMNMRQEGELGFTRLFKDFMSVSQTNDPNQLNRFVNDIDKRFYDVEDKGDFNTQVALVQPIFNGGKEWIGLDMAKLNSQASQYQLQRIKEMVTFNVINAYLNVYLAKKFIEVAQKAHVSAKEHVRITQAKFNAKTVVESDLLRAKVHLATIDEMILSSNNRFEIAQFMFLRSLGFDPDHSVGYIVTADPFESPGIHLPQTISDMDEAALIRTALTTRPDLKALETGIEMLSKQTKLQKTDYLPHINAFFNYNLHHEDNFDQNGDNWTAGASVSLNLFNGLATSGKVKKAMAQSMELEQKRKGLRQQIITEVQTAHRNLETALLRVKVTRNAIQSAQESLRIVSTRYNAGLIPFIQVTDAEVVSIQADTNHARALYDAKIAAAQIELATGQMDLLKPLNP